MTVESNQDVASILLQPEVFNSPTGIVEGSYIFADSENTNISLRPKLSIQYRTVESWLPPTVSLISPANGSTLWNESSPSLVGADNISFEVSQPVSNHTTINLCHGTQIRWLDCVQSTSNVENYSWDSILNLFNYTDIDEIESNAGDQWQYWRFRVDQEHRIDIINSTHRILRTNTFDGYENYTVELSRGSVFTLTGDNPMASDASTSI